MCCYFFLLSEHLKCQLMSNKIYQPVSERMEKPIKTIKAKMPQRTEGERAYHCSALLLWPDSNAFVRIVTALSLGLLFDRLLGIDVFQNTQDVHFPKKKRKGFITVFLE